MDVQYLLAFSLSLSLNLCLSCSLDLAETVTKGLESLRRGHERSAQATTLDLLSYLRRHVCLAFFASQSHASSLRPHIPSPQLHELSSTSATETPILGVVPFGSLMASHDATVLSGSVIEMDLSKVIPALNLLSILTRRRRVRL